MRLVPENRILIQPSVQLQWLEQNRTIEFVLTETQQKKFQEIWKIYQQSHTTSLVDFLNSDTALALELFDDDLNFSLLTGADYIGQRHANFTQQFFQPELVWSLSPKEASQCSPGQTEQSA